MRWNTPILVPVALVLGFSVGCMSASLEAPLDQSVMKEEEAWGGDMEMDDGFAAEPAAAPPPMEEAKRQRSAKPTIVGGNARSLDRTFRDGAPGDGAVDEAEMAEGEADGDKGGGGEDAARTRAWFPESFLWQPLVETGDDGVASVDVTVPDQLTTWRVLGLAHDRRGQQTGAVHQFDSRLPLYVDPVVPGWLYAGDELALPVQVVNTTDGPVTASLQAEGSGALSGAGAVTLPLSASGSDVVQVRVKAVSSGTGTLSATLDASVGKDRADRTVPVLPEGRPVQTGRGGTLAGERRFAMTSPKGADPTTQELTVRVFPGPLAVLQAEMERLQGGARPEDGAYGFALARELGALSASTAVELDPEAIRRLQLVAWQRIVRQSRASDHGIASDLLASMHGSTGHELASALQPQLVRKVVDGQRGDGTWSRSPSAPLQQVLVETAWAARALPASEEGARLRASGALERYGPQVEDPYTAAVLLASGVIGEGQAERLRELVLDAVVEQPDGERSIGVPSDVRNPWGYRPSRQEMLAWTTLALADQDQLTWRLDLAAQLMGLYDARWGFAAGGADCVALEAIASALPTVDKAVDVVLTVDDREVARATLDPTQPKVPATLIAATAGETGELGLRAEPPVPGLAFTASLESWVPWSGDESLSGVEVEVEVPPQTVGRQGLVTLSVSAPSGEVLEIEQGLPAGVVVDEARMNALGNPLQRWEASTDRVRMTTAAFAAGQVMELKIPVQPAFAGRFSTPPLTLKARSGREVFLPPVTWTVQSGGGS